MDHMLEEVRTATEQIRSDARVTQQRTRERLSMRRRQDLARRRESLRTETRRMRRAMSGVQALRALGQTVEVADYLRLVGAIPLYARNDTFDDVGVYLTTNGILVESRVYGIEYGSNDSIVGRGEYDPVDSFSIRIDYGLTDEFLLARHLDPIWCHYRVSPLLEADADEEEEGHWRVALRDCPADALLFQVLIDCSDPEKLGRYFKSVFR